MKYIAAVVITITLAISVTAYNNANSTYCTVHGDQLINYWDAFKKYGTMEEYLKMEPITKKWVKKCGSEDKYKTAVVQQQMADDYKILLTFS